MLSIINSKVSSSSIQQHYLFNKNQNHFSALNTFQIPKTLSFLNNITLMHEKKTQLNIGYHQIPMIISVLMVWLFGMIGAALPKSFIHKYNRQMIALSIGTIVAVIFVNLLPETFEIYFVLQLLQLTKNNTNTTNTHSNSATVKSVSKLSFHMSCWVLFGIGFGLIVESIVHATAQGHSHGHRGCGDECDYSGSTTVKKKNQDQIESIDVEYNNKLNLQIDSQFTAQNEDVYLVDESSSKEDRYTQIVDERVNAPDLKLDEYKERDKDISLSNLPTIVQLDFIAKFAHHFVDGMLIAARYSSSVRSGLAITLSIFAHSISANLGSFAMYVALGLSKRLAILIGALSSFSIVIGSLIAACIIVNQDYVNTNDNNRFIKFNHQIVPMSSGLFIYLVLADLVPLLMHDEHSTHETNYNNKISNTANKNGNGGNTFKSGFERVYDEHNQIIEQNSDYSTVNSKSLATYRQKQHRSQSVIFINYLILFIVALCGFVLVSVLLLVFSE